MKSTVLSRFLLSLGAYTMFSFFKSDPVKKLQKAHAQKLEQAMHAQRNGDMRSYAEITNEADQLWKQIQSLQKNSSK